MPPAPPLRHRATAVGLAALVVLPARVVLAGEPDAAPPAAPMVVPIVVPDATGGLPPRPPEPPQSGASVAPRSFVAALGGYMFGGTGAGGPGAEARISTTVLGRSFDTRMMSGLYLALNVAFQAGTPLPDGTGVTQTTRTMQLVGDLGWDLGGAHVHVVPHVGAGFPWAIGTERRTFTPAPGSPVFTAASSEPISPLLIVGWAGLQVTYDIPRAGVTLMVDGRANALIGAGVFGGAGVQFGG